MLGAVVAGVVPGEAALVAGLFPKANRELDRLDRFPALQDHGFAVGLDLLSAPQLQKYDNFANICDFSMVDMSSVTRTSRFTTKN